MLRQPPTTLRAAAMRIGITMLVGAVCYGLRNLPSLGFTLPKTVLFAGVIGFGGGINFSVWLISVKLVPPRLILTCAIAVGVIILAGLVFAANHTAAAISAAAVRNLLERLLAHLKAHPIQLHAAFVLSGASLGLPLAVWLLDPVVEERTKNGK